MDKPENKQLMTGKGTNFAELEARAERMIREGRMPNLGEFLRAIIAAREEYVRSLREEGAIAPDYEPSGIIDELLISSTDLRKPISVTDYERVRDALRDIIGPGSWGARTTRDRRRDAVVPIRSQKSDSPVGRDHEHDLTIIDEGTIVQFIPHTEAGEQFLRESLQSEPYQWLGNTLCVDHRMARGVIDAAESEALSIEFVG